MSKYDLHRPECSALAKYNSFGCQYWRDKLHQMLNGLTPTLEMPTKVRGAQQMHRDVEDGWLLLDGEAAAHDLQNGQELELEDGDTIIDLTAAQNEVKMH